MEGFKQKTQEELAEQVAEANNELDTEIIPKNLELKVLDMSLEEIKEKYPERYAIYLKLLRANKNNHQIDGSELEKMRVWIKALNSLGDHINTHSHHKESSDSRDKRQFDVFEDIRDHLEGGKIEGYIKLPTGVGKTVLFSRLVESLGLKTLIVVPSKILVGQTGDKLEKFTDVQFGNYFQGEKNLDENVTVTTYNSLIKGVKSGKIDPTVYGTLILDEAHKALGEETVKTIDQFACVKLGFTATPKYSRNKHVSDVLEHEIHSMSIVEAAQERLISRFKSYVAYTDIDISSVEIKNREQYDPETLAKAIDKESRNRAAVELYKTQFNGQLAIAYCGGVDHATHVAQVFNSSGLDAEIISGETPDKEKEEILERFRQGKTKILCNARILIEGFDEPKASVCLNLHPTLSYVDAEQRAGRVLRIDPDDKLKWGYVVDFIDRNPKVPPVTFAEIANESRVDPDNEPLTDVPPPMGGGGYFPVPDISLEGLRLVVDAQEVLKISHSFEKQRLEGGKETKEFLDFEILKEEVQKLGLKTQEEYAAVYKDHQGWHSSPQNYYKDRGWNGWPELFGKEYRKLLSFNNFVVEVRAAGINKPYEYNESYLNHKGWPAQPFRVYKDKGWESWEHLFGVEKKEKLSFEDLRKQVREAGIKNRSEYKFEYQNRKGWPGSPEKAYEEWTGWKDFLGTKGSYEPLEIVIPEVRRLGIKSSSEYFTALKKHPTWPTDPKRSKGWVDWYTFLGKEKPSEISLDELKERVRSLGINKQSDYQKESRLHDDWPSDPYSKYKDLGWNGWPDLFGKEYRVHLPFDQFKKEVKESGIRNANMYRNAYKQHKGWPSRPREVYGTDWNTIFSEEK